VRTAATSSASDEVVCFREE